jgi:hypothetical protein
MDQRGQDKGQAANVIFVTVSQQERFTWKHFSIRKLISGTIISIPNNSSSGNISPVR